MSVIYVDTSVLIKRAVPEHHSSSVTGRLLALAAAGDVLASSSLAWLESWRALRRRSLQGLDLKLASITSGVAEFPMDQAVLRTARDVGGDGLRSLDAIHLASAIMVGAHSMMTFDTRLGEAALAAGIDVLEL